MSTPPHPLQEVWSFWFEKSPAQSEGIPFSDRQSVVTTATSVEEFWQGFNSMNQVDILDKKASYHIMRKGVRPLWEDESNKNGGVFILRVDKPYAQHAWRELLMGLIGGQLSGAVDPSDQINGISISPRDNDFVISIWNQSDSAGTNSASRLFDFISQNIFVHFRAKAMFYKPVKSHKY
eukprot:TRINITY_DN25408_c0_g1_i1.p1 TRINITY_DN25408_c0_g1~~TRINITY_DN25408_c0_g1_i1.p1  ORF type:complete len:179 (-),score=16.41 TRINITY_DN25408_c0_g1_i1:6-542(-)